MRAVSIWFAYILTGQKGIVPIVCLKEKNGFLTQNFRVWNGIFHNRSDFLYRKCRYNL